MGFKESSLESQIINENQENKTTLNIFSVRNVALGLAAVVVAVGCIVTFAYKDQMFGSSRSFETTVQGIQSPRSNKMSNANGNGTQVNPAKPNKNKVITGSEIEKENEKEKEKENEKEKEKESVIKKEVIEENKIKEENGTIDKLKNENEEIKVKERVESVKQVIDLSSSTIQKNNNVDPQSQGFQEDFSPNKSEDDAEDEEDSDSSQNTGGNILFKSDQSLCSYSWSDDTTKKVYENITRENDACNLFYDPMPSSSSFDYNKVVYINLITKTYYGFEIEKNICVRNFNTENENERDVIMETNENIEEKISPCFNPEGTKILYAVRNENKVQQILSKNLSTNSEEIFKTFDKNSLLRSFKYSTDGTIFVALILNLSVRKYVFNIYDQNNNQSLKKQIEIDENFFLSDCKSNTICSDTGITNFSISQDNFKIAFTHEIQYDFISTDREIFVIDLTKTGFEPKKIYGPNYKMNKSVIYNSLHWSPNGENIILNEFGGAKLININSEASIKSPEDLKEKIGQNSMCLGWIN